MILVAGYELQVFLKHATRNTQQTNRITIKNIYYDS